MSIHEFLAVVYTHRIDLVVTACVLAISYFFIKDAEGNGLKYDDEE